MDNNYYTPKEVAEMLTISKIRVLQLIKTGDLQASKLGYRTYRISANAVENYLQSNKVQTPSLK